MLRCPMQDLESHRPPVQAFFVMTALIQVYPDYGLRRVQEHFLDVIACGICGADAQDVDE